MWLALYDYGPLEVASLSKISSAIIPRTDGLRVIAWSKQAKLSSKKVCVLVSYQSETMIQLQTNARTAD